MNPDGRGQGLAANADGRYAEAYQLLLPFAQAGDVEAQSVVGGLMIQGLHRFDSIEAVQASLEQNTFPPDRVEALAFLQAASDAGNGYASYTLAMAHVIDIGKEGWHGRRAQILTLLSKAKAQGFHSVDFGDPPGEEYLQFMERAAEAHRRYEAKGQFC